MKILISIICTILIISCRYQAGETKTEAGGKTETFNDSLTTPAAIDSVHAIQNRADYMRTNENHTILSTWAGDWNGAATVWRMPDTTAVFATERMASEMTMGGRYLVSNITGKIEDTSFEAQGTLGYDNAKKVFVSTWIDNFGTGITELEGNWNNAEHQLELKGKMTDPVTGKEADARENIRAIDKNNQFLELILYPGDKNKEQKLMEIKYSRANNANTPDTARMKK
jgi:uncharacterized protein DUF1579